MARNLTLWQEHGYGNWVILYAGSNEIISWAGLQYLPELDETEVGYLLSRKFWGQGFATEAAQRFIQYGFELIGLDFIIAQVHPENSASLSVVKNVG